MNELRKRDSNMLNLDEISLTMTKLLLYGDSKYENKVNKKIWLASINFVLSTKRFEGQLMWCFSQIYVCLQFFYIYIYIYIYIIPVYNKHMQTN